MRTGNASVAGHAAVLAGVFLLVGAGTAMAAAVALVSLSGVSTEEAVPVVVVATFLLGPALAGVVSVATARGAATSTAAAVAGGVGSLVGFYPFAALTLGTTVVVADAAGATPAVTVDSLLVPVLVAGLPTGAAGATGGYLGSRVGRRSRDHEPTVTSSRSTTGAAAPATEAESAPAAKDGTTGSDGGTDQSVPADSDGSTGDGEATDQGDTAAEATDDEETADRPEATDSERTGGVTDLFDDADEAVDRSN